MINQHNNRDESIEMTKINQKKGQGLITSNNQDTETEITRINKQTTDIKANLVYSSSRVRRRPKNEDGLKNEDDFKK